MEREKYQKELFDFESPKKAHTRFSGIFTKTDLAITLTPEKMVFAAIGMIMLIVVFFALGVEKGRSAAYAKFTAAKTAAIEAAAPAIPVKPARAPIAAVKSVTVTNITPKINPPAAAVKAQAVFDKTKPYMVVAAMFSRKDLALKEAGKLRMSGLETFVRYGEPYYMVCVGFFQSKSSAEKILNKIKQTYRDAYVRSR